MWCYKNFEMVDLRLLRDLDRLLGGSDLGKLERARGKLVSGIESFDGDAPGEYEVYLRKIDLRIGELSGGVSIDSDVGIGVAREGDKPPNHLLSFRDLEKIREEMGVSRHDVAMELGISDRTYRRLLSGVDRHEGRLRRFKEFLDSKGSGK